MEIRKAPSLRARAKQSSAEFATLDCRVATLLAMTNLGGVWE